MAALKKNVLSRERVTVSERNTFTKQREQKLKMRPVLLQPDHSPPQIHQQLNAMHLHQRLRYLKKRELTAQQNNRLLLRQFEEAQDTVIEMLTQTAAMKTIRTEYERYLEESAPRWQQQLKEKTQVAQTKKMGEHLRPCVKNTEERETASSAEPPLLPQGSTTMTQHITAPPEHYSPNCHLDYNQDGSPHLCYAKSSWQNRLQSQTDRFPIRGPHQPRGSSCVPPAFLPPHIFPHHHSLQHNLPSSSPGDGHPGPGPNPPGSVALQPEYLRSWVAGPAGTPSARDALWSQLCTEQTPPEMGMAQAVGEECDPSRAPSSKTETSGGGRSSHLSQELDSKPVRLSGSLMESSESSREPSRASMKKRKKRRSHCSFSGSQESSRGSSAIAAVKVVQSPESDASSEKGRSSTRKATRRSGGLAVGSPRAEKVKGSKGADPRSHKEESRPTSEEMRSPMEESRGENTANTNPDDKAESCGEESASQKEESESVSMNIEDREEPEKHESSSSEQNKGDEDGDEDDGAVEEKENGQTDQEQEKSNEDHGASGRKNATEEDEEQESEDEEPVDEEQESEDEELGEDESDGGEESDEEEHGDAAGEKEGKSDSDDSIILPQDKSSKMHVIHEEGSEDEEEEGSRMGSSGDDVENLLAPQQQPEKKEKDLTADEQPKAMCDNVAIFQVEPNKSTKSENASDSDEFDNFFA
ncbi:ABC transporter F family member 4-like [Pungitius pungitius]|uniref:ABC transporter F family member 4-like n=1 Tax=Pungitius pungitius TaxID=134920 RepID=UPI002E0E7055